MIPSFIVSFSVEQDDIPPHIILLDLRVESGILWGAQGNTCAEP
jgi:hypothetical protein